ncbi:MAG: hypothetical protein WBW53_22080 [Terriglobales bacterium]
MNCESQWTVYRTRFLVRARQLTEPLVFTDALGREQSGRPGDYLVETSEGITRITSQALFEDIYVPLVVPPFAPKQFRSAAKEVTDAGQIKDLATVAARPVTRSSPESRAQASA